MVKTFKYLVRYCLTVLTESEARYLLEIYEAHESGVGYVGPQYLARRLKVKRPTAYEMLQSLVRKGALQGTKGKYCITPAGIEMARRILRNHRIIETMLYRAGVDLETACKCASRIQNEIEDEIIEKLREYLGNPDKCPHGRPIPQV